MTALVFHFMLIRELNISKMTRNMGLRLNVNQQPPGAWGAWGSPVIVEEVSDLRAGFEIRLVLVRLGNHDHESLHGSLARAEHTR
jgi:hypothetical protein